MTRLPFAEASIDTRTSPTRQENADPVSKATAIQSCLALRSAAVRHTHRILRIRSAIAIGGEMRLTATCTEDGALETSGALSVGP